MVKATQHAQSQGEARNRSVPKNTALLLWLIIIEGLVVRFVRLRRRPTDFGSLVDVDVHGEQNGMASTSKSQHPSISDRRPNSNLQMGLIEGRCSPSLSNDEIISF